jgi:hypothetical protein
LLASALHQLRPETGGLDGRRFVGAGERFDQDPGQQAVTKHLRRLRLPQAVARLGTGHTSLPASARFSVSATGTASRPPTGSSASSSQRTVSIACDKTGARSVMHQHPVFVVGRRRRSVEAIADAGGSCRAATENGFEFMTQACPIMLPPPSILWRQHYPDTLDARMATKGCETVIDQWLAGKHLILFGRLAAKARSDPAAGTIA